MYCSECLSLASSRVRPPSLLISPLLLRTNCDRFGEFYCSNAFFVSFRLWTFLSSPLMKCLILSHVSQRRSSDMSLTQYVSPVYVVCVFVYCATIMCFVVLLLDIWWLVRSTYGYTTRLGQQVANPRTGRWYEIHLQTKTLLQHYTHK